ncbi:MAG: hypothetical protein K2H66_05085 [Oscillospiraceae bacterium]|nr:hypothetical protein [Oscillospiraceae bacterium]
MRMQELHQFTKASVSKYHKTAWGMAWLCPMIWLVMKLIPDILSGLLLKLTPTTTSELFFGKIQLWVLFAFLWELLCFCVLIPVFCSVCSWFNWLLGFGKKKLHVFQDRYFFWHSMRFFGVIELIKFLILIPFVSACILTVYTFQKCTLQEDAGLWLFATVQGIAICIWTAIYYIKFLISLFATPFLFLEKPNRSVLQAISLSRKLLDKQYGKLFLILVSNLFLPNQITMLVLFLQIRIREYLQEQEVMQEAY